MNERVLTVRDMEAVATQFGFKWGQVTVERWASHNGHLILGITTPCQVLQIRITPKGLIRMDEIKPR
jgi:hypothetical protein